MKELVKVTIIVLSALILTWLDRKIKARSQFRVGPPFYQQFVDLIKLFQKENLRNFLANPAINFLPAISLGAILIICAESPLGPISGNMNLVTLIFFLLLISFSYIVIGIASASTYGYFGAKREILQIVVYEIPFLLSLVCVGIVNKSTTLSNTKFSTLLILPMVVYLFCMFVKTKRSPFDIPNATQEIIEGPATELSGPSLAMLYLAEWIEAYFFTSLFFVLYLPMKNLFFHIVCSWLLFVFVSFVDVLTPRVRLEDMLAFFTKFILPLSIIGVIICYCVMF